MFFCPRPILELELPNRGLKNLPALSFRGLAALADPSPPRRMLSFQCRPVTSRFLSRRAGSE